MLDFRHRVVVQLSTNSYLARSTSPGKVLHFTSSQQRVTPRAMPLDLVC